MTSADLLAALTPVADALEAVGARYYITGSLAAAVHGHVRSSVDADFVADLQPAHVDELVERLRGRYYVDCERIRAAVRLRRSFNVIHLATMFKVDVFVSHLRVFEQAALSRAQSERLDDSPAGRTFRVATAEDVILSKLEWFKAGGETSERQWTDIIGVLKVQHGRLDVDYLRRTAQALAVTPLLERALAEAEPPHAR